MTDELTDLERDVLSFERQWYLHPGAKEQNIRDRFQLSPVRYYQLLNGLLDRPAATLADPMLIKRLRRIRADRAMRRSLGRPDNQRLLRQDGAP